MKEIFKERAFTGASLELIESCNDVVDEYQRQGLMLTLRQLYYQLVSRNIILNAERAYKNLSSLVSDARLAGMLDWEAIEDRIRVPVIPSEWPNLQDLVDSALYSYRLPRWETQENYVELWVEKDALAGVLRPLAHQYHVPMMVNRGYCVAPNTRILTSDLRWVAADSARPGLKLIGVDENVPGYRKHRKLRETSVEAVHQFMAPRIQVITDHGAITVSRNHPFLATPDARHGYKWLCAERLKLGARIAWLTAPWIEDYSWDAGWLAGMFDGEGCLPATVKSRMMSVYQKPGSLLTRLRDELTIRGYATHEPDEETTSDTNELRIYSAGSILSFLGQIRPKRLLEAFLRDLHKGSWAAKGKSPAVVMAVEPLADGPVVGIQTGTRTLITEGFVSHNSSQSAMYEASRRYLNQSDNKVNRVIIYLGDFDPSGEDMVRDIGDRMQVFGCGAEFEIRKIALTLKQVKFYKPPPNPTKHKDPRSKEFIAKYGASSWEVDAINPKELSRIVKREIESYIDKDAMGIIVEKENDDKIKLTKSVQEIMEGI